MESQVQPQGGHSIVKLNNTCEQKVDFFSRACGVQLDNGVTSL